MRPETASRSIEAEYSCETHRRKGETGVRLEQGALEEKLGRRAAVYALLCEEKEDRVIEDWKWRNDGREKMCGSFRTAS